jgi:hypothetical protein
VKVEDPSALRFILQDELYLLEEDKPNYITDSNRIAAPEPQIETPQITFNYLGSNKKNFVILVHYPAHEFIAEDHLTALESVLTRKNHTRDDVAILNTAKNEITYESLKTFFLPQTILILGQQSIPQGIKQTQFNRFENHDSLNILHTFSFDAMMSSTDNKKAFWEQMKTL